MGVRSMPVIVAIDVLLRVVSAYYAFVFALGMLWFGSTTYSAMALALACVLIGSSAIVKRIYPT